MATWNDLATADPDLADAGRRLLTRSGIGEGLLATVRGDAPPRIHPVYAEVVDGRLLTFVIEASAKAADLATDGRYALHTHVDIRRRRRDRTQPSRSEVEPGQEQPDEQLGRAGAGRDRGGRGFLAEPDLEERRGGDDADAGSGPRGPVSDPVAQADGLSVEVG